MGPQSVVLLFSYVLLLTRITPYICSELSIYVLYCYVVAILLQSLKGAEDVCIPVNRGQNQHRQFQLVNRVQTVLLAGTLFRFSDNADTDTLQKAMAYSPNILLIFCNQCFPMD